MLSSNPSVSGDSCSRCGVVALLGAGMLRSCSVSYKRTHQPVLWLPALSPDLVCCGW